MLGSSYDDISKIIRRYTDDVKNASMVINSYLRKNEFIVFDLTRSEDDPLANQLMHRKKSIKITCALLFVTPITFAKKIIMTVISYRRKRGSNR